MEPGRAFLTERQRVFANRRFEVYARQNGQGNEGFCRFTAKQRRRYLKKWRGELGREWAVAAKEIERVRAGATAVEMGISEREWLGVKEYADKPEGWAPAGFRFKG